MLRGRVEATRAVRMKEVRRDIMMIVYVNWSKIVTKLEQNNLREVKAS